MLPKNVVQVKGSFHDSGSLAPKTFSQLFFSESKVHLMISFLTCLLKELGPESGSEIMVPHEKGRGEVDYFK